MAVHSETIRMMDGFTIYAYTLGNGSSLSYVADEARAYCEARSHRGFLREDPNRHPPERIAIYRVKLRPLPVEAILDILNERGSVVERFVAAMEPIGAVADVGGMSPFLKAISWHTQPPRIVTPSMYWDFPMGSFSPHHHFRGGYTLSSSCSSEAVWTRSAVERILLDVASIYVISRSPNAVYC
jgi:hypothetical protein